MRALRPYQEEAAQWLVGQRRGILGDEPGLGKTPVALVAADRVRAHRVLVVCPLSLVRHWADHAHEWVGYWRVIVGAGPREERARTREAWSYWPGPAVLITNYEAVRTDGGAQYVAPNLTVIFDEAHRLKGRRTKTFRECRVLVWAADRAWFLTGTPIMNRVDELWSLLHLIDPHTHRSYWRWVSEYCDVQLGYFRGRAVRQVGGVRPERLPELRARLASVMLRREARTVLPNLPPLTWQTVPLDLSAPERAAYERLCRAFYADIGGNLILAPNEAAKILRLRQLCVDWGVFGAERDGTKMRALFDLLDSLDPEPVVVFSAYRWPVLTVRDRLGAPAIFGAMGGRERQDALRRWERGDHRVLVGTIGAMGEGLNLQRARYAVFLDLDWVPARNDQAVARLWRLGQSRPVVAYTLVARNTIDQYVADVLAQKLALVDALIGTDWTNVLGVRLPSPARVGSGH